MFSGIPACIRVPCIHGPAREGDQRKSAVRRNTRVGFIVIVTMRVVLFCIGIGGLAAILLAATVSSGL